MSKFIGCVLSTAFAAILLGCGPGKELPEEVAPHKENMTVAPDPAGTVPDQTDPAAKVVADRAIKAITQDKAESQGKTRISRAAAHGKYKNPNNGEMIDASRSVMAVWPDRLRVTYEFKEGFLPKQTFGLRSPYGWVQPPLPTYQPPSMYAKIIETDMTAQHWIPLSLTLSDHKAIFFGFQSNKSPSDGTSSFKLGWLNRTDRPIYIITCSDKTGLPVKIEFSPSEGDPRMRANKVFTLADHKPVDGLMIPHHMTMTINTVLVESWTVDAWEFPGIFDDSQFDQAVENSKK